MPVKLVIFDLGRVLIRICDNWQHAAEAAELGVALPAMTPQLQDDLHRLVIQSETGKIDSAQFYERCGRHFGIDASQVVKLSDAYLLGPFEGIERLIADMSATGLKTACLTNTNGNHWQAMTARGGSNALPLHLLDYQFASHLVGLRKPDAAIYEHVERATGIAPPNILFFDDLAENIAPAIARGWNAVQITDRDDPVRQMRSALPTYDIRI